MPKMPRTTDARPTKATKERRTLHRLRDLCDEVLASYRVARGHQVLSDRDREEANVFLGNLVPLPVRRRV